MELFLKFIRKVIKPVKNSMIYMIGVVTEIHTGKYNRGKYLI